MENIKEFIEKIGAISLFCIAGTLLLTEYKEQYKLISVMRKNVNKQGVIYEQPMDELGNDKATYKEVMASLFRDLDYDVVINSIYLQKESYNPLEFDFSVISNTDYTKTYEVDSSGNIIKVIYKSLT